ncbi:MAG: thioredoxin family protein [Deltaproteobacteria bacterium]|mgnify:FL=1|nr:MAG: thioredoxin family protein [Deltaproteobacteria bacterium]
MKIEVLGTGCAKCNKLYEATKEAIAEAGVDAELVKVEKITEIASRGVLVTPALTVDGEVKFSGKVPKVSELVKAITG